jgi:hypothetical protein
MFKQLIILLIYPFHEFWFLLTKVGAERPRNRFQCGQKSEVLPFSVISNPTPLPLLLNVGPGTTSPGVKRPGREVDHLSSYNTDVRGVRPLLLHKSSWYSV